MTILLMEAILYVPLWLPISLSLNLFPNKAFVQALKASFSFPLGIHHAYISIYCIKDQLYLHSRTTSCLDLSLLCCFCLITSLPSLITKHGLKIIDSIIHHGSELCVVLFSGVTTDIKFLLMVHHVVNARHTEWCGHCWEGVQVTMLHKTMAVIAPCWSIFAKWEWWWKPYFKEFWWASSKELIAFPSTSQVSTVYEYTAQVWV